VAKVKEYLSWVHTIIHTDEETRWGWVELIMRGFRSYRNGKQGKYVRDKEYLSDALSDPSRFQLVGFAPNIQYVKVEGTEDQLKGVYIHPFGTPQLLYKHRDLPMLIIAGPGIRLDDSILKETGDVDGDIPLIGITG
jgi:hypothetical protein